MLDCRVPKNEKRKRKQECMSFQIVDSLVKNDPRKNGATQYTTRNVKEVQNLKM